MVEQADAQNQLEARGGIEPPMRVLQTLALPLGYRAAGYSMGTTLGLTSAAKSMVSEISFRGRLFC